MMHYSQMGYLAGMHVRSSLIFLIYRKTLRMLPGQLEKMGFGLKARRKLLRRLANQEVSAPIP